MADVETRWPSCSGAVTPPKFAALIPTRHTRPIAPAKADLRSPRGTDDALPTSGSRPVACLFLANMAKDPVNTNRLVPTMMKKSATFQELWPSLMKSTAPRALPGADQWCNPRRSNRLLLHPPTIRVPEMTIRAGRRHRASADRQTAQQPDCQQIEQRTGQAIFVPAANGCPGKGTSTVVDECAGRVSPGPPLRRLIHDSDCGKQAEHHRSRRELIPLHSDLVAGRPKTRATHSSRGSRSPP